jgi:hypothetical protein
MTLEQEGFRFAVSPDRTQARWIHPAELAAVHPDWTDCTGFDDDQFFDHMTDPSEKGEAHHMPACITGCEEQGPVDEEPEQPASLSRSMKVMFKHVCGITVAMYQTSWHRADGSLAFRELVDMSSEVVWG